MMAAFGDWASAPARRSTEGSRPAWQSAEALPKSAASLDNKASQCHSPALSGAGKSADATSKQAHVIARLESPTGTTIAATGWQQHSVRGFLSGVVRKKLKLKLASIKVDGNRVYRIDGESPPKASGPQSKRRPA
jgi:hypothetical protein